MRHRGDVRTRHIQHVDAPQLPLLLRHRDLPLLFHRRYEQHVRGLTVQLEVLAHTLSQDARRERPEPLAKLDLEIHLRLHARAPRIAENAAGPKRARAEFHAAIEPSNDLFRSQKACDALQQGLPL